MRQVRRNRRRVVSNSSGILSEFNLRDLMDDKYMLVRRFLYRIRRDISEDFHVLDWKFLEPPEDIEESGEYADLHMIIYDCKSLKYNLREPFVGININVIGRANTVDISDVGRVRHHINNVTVYLATRRNIESDNCDGFIFSNARVGFGRSDIDTIYCKQLSSTGINGGHVVYGHINYDKLKTKT